MTVRAAAKRDRGQLERFQCIPASPAPEGMQSPPVEYLTRLNTYVRTRALTDSNRQPRERDHVLLLLEDPDRDPELAGVVSLGRRAAGDGWYIDLAAVASAHQGGRLGDGRSFSDALIAAAFDHVRAREAVSPGSAKDLGRALVFGSVHRLNGRARAVLVRNGFVGFELDPDLDEHLLAVCPVAL